MSSKIGMFGPQILLKANTPKIPRSVPLPTDTRHVLKYCEYPSRDANGTDSKRTKSSKIGSFGSFGPQFLGGGDTQTTSS